MRYTLALTVLAALQGIAVFAEDSAQSAPAGVWIDGGNVIVVVPRSRDLISAYSIPRGKWHQVQLDTPLPPEQHVAVAGNMAAFQTHDAIYGFSAYSETGWCKLPIGSDDKTFLIDNDQVQFNNQQQFCIFGAYAKGWSRIDLDTGELQPTSQAP